MKKDSYHNTNKESGNTLKKSNKKAAKQEDIILDFFRKNPELEITPSKVHNRLFDDTTPLTSIRRSITNLTNKGLLEKTGEMEMSPFGKKEHKWKLAK